MTEQSDDRGALIFVSTREEGKRGSDAWFWPEIGAGDEDIFDFPIHVLYKTGKLTLEQARDLTARIKERQALLDAEMAAAADDDGASKAS